MGGLQSSDSALEHECGLFPSVPSFERQLVLFTLHAQKSSLTMNFICYIVFLPNFLPASVHGDYW